MTKSCGIVVLILFLISGLYGQTGFYDLFEPVNSFTLSLPDSVPPMGEIRDIDVNPSGEMFLLEGGGSRIMKFSRKGVFVKQWGGKNAVGKYHLSVLGSAFIDTSRSELIVADWLKGRVVFFDYNGKYKDSFLTSSHLIGIDGAIPHPTEKNWYAIGGIIAQNHQFFREKEYYAKGMHIFDRKGKYRESAFDLYRKEILEKNNFNYLTTVLNLHGNNIIAGYITSYKISIINPEGKIERYLNEKPDKWHQLEISAEDAFKDLLYSFSTIRSIDVHNDHIIVLYSYYSQEEKTLLSTPQLLIYNPSNVLIGNGIEVSWLSGNDNQNARIFRKGFDGLFYAVRLKDGSDENSGYEVGLFKPRF
ncbi:hypothetical protein JW877_01750 [bacterium]|nr:hypothetical protein [bacterium]